jgi:single-stranded DNA-binding protein
VPIKVFGRLAEQASAWKPGTVLSVSGRLGGRDWQGKVYGDNVANSIEVVNEGTKGGDGPRDDEAPHDLDDTPF